MAPTYQPAKIAFASLALFILGLVLTAYSARNPAVGQFGVSAIDAVMRPFALSVSAGRTNLLAIWDEYVELLSLRTDYKRLQDRVSTLESLNLELHEVAKENERLRSVLDMKERSALKGVVADVIAYDPVNWVQAVTVDVGSADGISIHQPVLDERGNVVGQVVVVGARTARVLLVTDHASGVDALIQGTRVRGVFEGLGQEMARLNFVPRDANIAVGDRVVSSGLDGIFPKGRLLGTVVHVGESQQGLFRSVHVRPAIHGERLETVLIVTAPQLTEEAPL